MKNILVDYDNNPIKEEDGPLIYGKEEEACCLDRVRAAVAATHGGGPSEVTIEDLLVLAYLQGAMDMIMDQELEELEQEKMALQSIPNKSKTVH